MTANRRGVPLCAAFQTGTCTGSDAQARCLANPSRAHQCAKCLTAGHGAHACSHNPAAEPRSAGKSSGKGKKGKGKGYGKYHQN